MGKHPREIFKNTYFKEHLCKDASELTLWSIVWNFVSGLHLKPSQLSNITKIPMAFKSEFILFDHTGNAIDENVQQQQLNQYINIY